MKEIKAKHYIDTIIYSTEQILKCFKLKFVQYFNTLNLEITAEQFIVLDMIYCNDKICQRDLAKLILKDKSNMTRLLNILEKNAYIKRNLGKKNNRLINQICITNKGKELIDENMKIIKNFLMDTFKNVTDEEISFLHSLGKKFKEDLMLSLTLNI